jgi:hypothetical protein
MTTTEVGDEKGIAQSEQHVHISCKTAIPHAQTELHLFVISKHPERMNLQVKEKNKENNGVSILIGETK